MEPSTQQHNNYPLQIQSDKPVNWRKYMFLFFSNWYWFFITVFIAITIAYLKNRYTIPSYKTTATLLIEEDEETSDFLNEIKSVNRRRRTTDLANEMAKLNAFSLHRRTMDSLGWNIFWTGHGRLAMKRPLYNNPPYHIEIDPASAVWYRDRPFYIDPDGENEVRFYNKNGIDTVLSLNNWNKIHGWRFKIKRSEYIPVYSSYSFVYYSPNTLAQLYRSRIISEADEEKSKIIRVNSQGSVASIEIEYINALCNNYIFSGLERKRRIAENTLEFIEDQILIIENSLHQIEKQLLTFRLDENVVDLSREGQMAYDKLQNFYNHKTQLTLKKNYYLYLKDYINKKRDPQAIISPTLVEINDQLLIDQVRSLQQLYEEREQLEFSASLENPGVAQINSRIQTVRLKILDILNGLIHSNELAWDQIDVEEKSVEEQLLQLPVSEQELLNIQRKHDVNNQFYKFLLEKRAEAGIKLASTVSNIRILDKASLFNTAVVGTKKSILYLFALLIGLIIPGGIIYLADSLDTRIKDRTDIEENTDIPILGIVSHDASRSHIPVNDKRGSAFAESFRHIRTNLNYVLRDPSQKVIMVTSTISGEGKTFIALNLATILALNDKKVLLAGFDLRRPSLHKIFNLDNSEGISTYLSKQSKLEDAIYSSNVPGLDILIAGPVPPNPAELIETDLMKNMINTISDIYDFVVIDTPPMALVTDAQLISKYTHATIYVIRQNFSPKGVLEHINNYKVKQTSEMSLLVNDIKESTAFGYRYYYGYDYSYNYYYKYGDNYYHDEKNGEKT